MRRRRLILGTLAMTYGKMVTAFAQLMLVPVLANAWGVQLYGQWLMLATVPIFLAASDLGFGTAAGNRLIGQIAQGQRDAALVTFRSALAVVVSCSSLLAAVAATIVATLPESFFDARSGMDGPTARHVLWILIAYGAVALQGSLFMAVMRSEGAFARSTTFEATMQLIEALSVAAVALRGDGPFAAAIALLVVRTGGVCGHIALARSHASWLSFASVTPAPRVMIDLLRPALAGMLIPLATAGLLQGTALAVGAAAGAAAVPVYTSLRTLSRVGLQLLMTVNLPILPEFTGEHARGNEQWIRRTILRLTGFNAVAGLVGAAIMVLFGNSLLALWTHGAIQAPALMLKFVAVGILVSAVWNLLCNLLVAVNRHEPFALVLLASSLLVVPLTYLAADAAGLSGAAAAVSAFDVILLAIAGWQTRAVFMLPRGAN